MHTDHILDRLHMMCACVCVWGGGEDINTEINKHSTDSQQKLLQHAFQMKKCND